MFRNLAIIFMLGLNVCTNSWARDERAFRAQDPEREMTDDRRERFRDQREEFRAMREQLRDRYRQDAERSGARGGMREDDDGRRGPGLRRLEPEDRERLRRAMREAAREHYGR